jgi:hypothetical protein
MVLDGLIELKQTSFVGLGLKVCRAVSYAQPEMPAVMRIDPRGLIQEFTFC